MNELLTIYRERNGHPDFWAEPFNAISNISFLLAAIFALKLAYETKIKSTSTMVLITLAGSIGMGSFAFHTFATPFTMWLDIIPIAVFQVFFLWLVCRYLMGMPSWISLLSLTTLLTSSFYLMSIHNVLNGSLFYIPSLLALFITGTIYVMKTDPADYLLLITAFTFTVSIIARTIDWNVPWACGTHFLWHLINGGVIYLCIRVWIVHQMGVCKK